MLATVMNCIYVSEIFRTRGHADRSLYTICVRCFYNSFFQRMQQLQTLNAGKVVFFAGGTGHPYFSTDTGTALRAIEIEADAILLAKAMDGDL